MTVDLGIGHAADHPFIGQLAQPVQREHHVDVALEAGPVEIDRHVAHQQVVWRYLARDQPHFRAARRKGRVPWDQRRARQDRDLAVLQGRAGDEGVVPYCGQGTASTASRVGWGISSMRAMAASGQEPVQDTGILLPRIGVREVGDFGYTTFASAAVSARFADRPTETGNIQSSAPCVSMIGKPRKRCGSLTASSSGWKLAATGARWVNGESASRPLTSVKVPPSLMPVSRRRSGLVFQRSFTQASTRLRCAVSVSGSIMDQVSPLAVGATRIKPRLRASRTHVHRNSRPCPAPPCNATMSGAGSAGSWFSGT